MNDQAEPTKVER